MHGCLASDPDRASFGNCLCSCTKNHWSPSWSGGNRSNCLLAYESSEGPLGDDDKPFCFALGPGDEKAPTNDCITTLPFILAKAGSSFYISSRPPYVYLHQTLGSRLLAQAIKASSWSASLTYCLNAPSRRPQRFYLCVSGMKIKVLELCGGAVGLDAFSIYCYGEPKTSLRSCRGCYLPTLAPLGLRLDGCT